jgi:predicted anti-sigma-YlaC factor YlaD
MCPDRQLISLYFDDELPSPWKEKMEAHLESCTECRTVLAGYRNLGERFRDLPERSLETAQKRVWEKLSERRIIVPKEKIWHKNISLPLPAAAAVLVFILFFALVGIRGLVRPAPQEQLMAAGLELDDYGMLHLDDMSEVLKYLSSQDDNGDFTVIVLPESRKFSRVGEPALINAADYSRRTTYR